MLPVLVGCLVLAGSFGSRAKDWRIGAVVYQVFPDRFVPPSNWEAKKRDYPAPQRLMPWSETPEPGKRLPGLGLWSHELDFWGGDLRGVESKLDYIHSLEADVLYLTPIFKAFSNHKYDTTDYFTIDPALGTRKDLDALIAAVHGNGMKLMLDGVFNHVGKHSKLFQEASSGTSSPKRDWFYFDMQYPNGYRGWAGVANLPALRLENKAVRDYLWNSRQSVVQHYLNEGIDGWRLDVAFEIGPKFLTELTEHAHAAKPGSAVVGEISGYPADWFPAVDGVFNFFAIGVGIEAVNGDLPGGRAGKMLEHMVQDAGIDNALKSWLLTDNHDTARLANVVPDFDKRMLIHLLQLTLPGCPVIYYGSELGMTGAGDPQNRAPMRWDLANSKNKEFAWVKKLLAVRRKLPALRYGDFTALDTDKLLAFTRTTDKLRDAVIVVVNPTADTVREVFSTRIGRLMSWGQLEDRLTGQRVASKTGLVDLELKPHQAMILTPVIDKSGGYSPYDRVP